VAAVREGVWRGVKSQEGQWAQRPWQEHRDIDRRRYLVEPWLGSLKGLYGSCCRERGLEMALGAVWGRLPLLEPGPGLVGPPPPHYPLNILEPVLKQRRC